MHLAFVQCVWLCGYGQARRLDAAIMLPLPSFKVQMMAKVRQLCPPALAAAPRSPGRSQSLLWIFMSCPAGNELWVELNDAAASVSGPPMNAERAVGNKKAVLLWYSRRALQ